MSVKPPNRLISDDDDDGASAASPSPSAARTSEPKRAGEGASGATSAEEIQTKRRRSNGQGPYPGRRQVTAHIDRQLFLWLKSISAQTDKPMVEIFEEALTAYVNSFAAQRKFGARPEG